MKKFLVAVGVVGLLTLFAHQAFSDELENIRLEKKNTVSLREEYTGSSTDNVKAALINISNSLPAKEHIRLVLNTPGGEVVAGSNLNTVIQGIKNPVDVIVQFAASMGYLTTQATTGKRYILPDGILMAHRAYLGVQGQTPGEIGTRLSFYEKMTNDLAAMAAKRTGITAEAYQQKVLKEYWVQGADAVKDHQADEVVNVSCSSDLDGTYAERIYTFFGPVDIEWANCPLISEPVAIEVPRGELNGMSELDYDKFKQAVNDMFTKSKLDIVNDYQLQSTFHSFVR